MWKLNDSSEETARDRLQRKTHCDRKVQANLKMIKGLEYLTKEVTQTTKHTRWVSGAASSAV